MELDKTIEKDLKAGLLSVDELANYLVRSFPSTVLAKELAMEMLKLKKPEIKPVVLTMDEFNAHFRVQGYRIVDGVLKQEVRGNKRKDL